MNFKAWNVCSFEVLLTWKASVLDTTAQHRNNTLASYMMARTRTARLNAV
jgi:hypothetical protein